METSAQDITAPSAVYEIGGRCFDGASRAFAEAIAAAHDAHLRPRCMCLRRGSGQGVEMYVARLGAGYIVKRMPDTGSHHAHNCLSYEPPAEMSGLGQVLGNAITEDPTTGLTRLKLDFPLTKAPGRHQQPPAAGSDSASVATGGTRLSLRGLLHYLWDQSELTHWQPGFAGRRNWATVRWHLLQAAQGKTAGGQMLQDWLYIPESFTVERREQINARRLAQWKHAVRHNAGHARLMLLIGEVKEIAPTRYGHKAVIKQVPDQPIFLDEQLYRRMTKRFAIELAIWGAHDTVHMLLIGTFALTGAGLPALEALSLMPVTAQWLPIENAAELQLIDRLTREGRRFIKGLRYNMPTLAPLTSATLLDAEQSPINLWITDGMATPEDDDEAMGTPDILASEARWIWNVGGGPMPALPQRRPAVIAQGNLGSAAQRRPR